MPLQVVTCAFIAPGAFAAFGAKAGQQIRGVVRSATRYTVFIASHAIPWQHRKPCVLILDPLYEQASFQRA
jgi:hypothetical protein